MFFTRDKSFYKTLVTLAIPIALQNAVTFAVGLADNVMIGTLGDSAISGVYVGSQLQTLLQMFIGGIEGAILILAAQYWGKRDTKSIRRIAAIGVRFALLIGLVITVTAFLLPSQIVSLFTSDASVIESGTVYVRVVSLSYIFFCISQVMVATMRAVETAKIGLYVSFVTLIVNVICNYILIFGKLGFPALGVTGAAVATLFSRIIEAAVMVVYVRCVDKKLKLRFADLLKRGGELTRDFLRYGLPIMGGQVVWSVNMLGQTMILGRYDAGVIAAVSIANMLHNMMYIAMNGLSSAVGIITGKTVGSGRMEKFASIPAQRRSFSLASAFFPALRCISCATRSSGCTARAMRPWRMRVSSSMSFPLQLSARAIRRRACSALLNPAATFRLSSATIRSSCSLWCCRLPLSRLTSVRRLGWFLRASNATRS